MAREECGGLGSSDLQCTDPVWEPLVTAVGERLAEGFMWMHEVELDGGSSLNAYKHVHTRRYLYLTEDGRSFTYAPCGRFLHLRLHLAIEDALCTWWILSGWEAEDAQAIREAVMTAAERSIPRS